MEHCKENIVNLLNLLLDKLFIYFTTVFIIGGILIWI